MRANRRTPSPGTPKASVVVIGNFDGVHFAHRRILKKAVALAHAGRLRSVLLSFDPHPARLLSPDVAPKMINTLVQKKELVSSLGINEIVVQKFDRALARLSPQSFFKKYLLKKLNAKCLLVGHDFTFGAKRSGTAETLEMLGYEAGVDVEVVPAQIKQDTLVSSSLIRKLIVEGRVDLAKKFLERFFFIDGIVVEGHHRGAALGLHTANLVTENELLPADGVYATLVSFKNRLYQSATNIGYNPTFNNVERSIETHIFDFDDEIYQQKLRLHFVKKLRDEIKFVSPEALVLQIKKDIAESRKILSRTKLKAVFK